MKLAESGFGLAKNLARENLSREELETIRQASEGLETQFGVSITAQGDWEEESTAAEEFVHQRLFPFLDASGLIISGGDLQALFELRIDRRPYLFSWREWGGYQAEWKNKHFSKPSGQFAYIDFYSSEYVAAIVADYERFLENLRIIRGVN